MLVLTRRKNESIVIPSHGIEISIVSIGKNGTRCRIGIKAPDGTRILRTEILKRDMEDKNVEAA